MTNRLVWRAGFGAFYNPRLTGVDSSGFNTATPMVTTLDSVTPVGSLSNPFPNGLNLAPCAQGSPECLAGATGTFRNPRPTTPKTGNYSTGFQLQLPGQWLVDAAYVGSVTSRFNPTWAINAPPARFLSLGLDLLRPVANPFFGLIPASVGALGARTIPLYQLLAPYPFYSLGGPLQPGVGHTTYQSMQLSVEHRLAANFAFLGSYTLSKLMSRQNYMNTGFSDFIESTILDIDRPQRLVLNGIWEMPFGEGQRFRAGNAFLDKVIGGWQFSGIASFQGGGPIRTPSGAIATGQPVRLSGEPTIAKWFNTGAFIVQPGLPQPLGQRTLTLYLGDFRGHGINNFDLSAAKNTKIGERFRLQFRSEYFNAFNRVQWGNPDTGITGSNYGKITSQANIPRQIQFGLKLIY